jgi:hypothetical protein
MTCLSQFEEHVVKWYCQGHEKAMLWHQAPCYNPVSANFVYSNAVYAGVLGASFRVRLGGLDGSESIREVRGCAS